MISRVVYVLPIGFILAGAALTPSFADGIDCGGGNAFTSEGRSNPSCGGGGGDMKGSPAPLLGGGIPAFAALAGLAGTRLLRRKSNK